MNPPALQSLLKTGIDYQVPVASWLYRIGGMQCGQRSHQEGEEEDCGLVQRELFCLGVPAEEGALPRFSRRSGVLFS